MVEKKSAWVGGSRMNDARVVDRMGFVKCCFVEVHVLFVGEGVYCETRILVQSEFESQVFK